MKSVIGFLRLYVIDLLDIIVGFAAGQLSVLMVINNIEKRIEKNHYDGSKWANTTNQS